MECVGELMDVCCCCVNKIMSKSNLCHCYFVVHSFGSSIHGFGVVLTLIDVYHGRAIPCGHVVLHSPWNYFNRIQYLCL
jgi:hypothetical protein